MESTLRKIASDIRAVIDEIDKGHQIDADALRTAARRIEAQAEMVSLGIDHGEQA